MQVLNKTPPTRWNDGFMERAEVGLMGYPPFNCSGTPSCLPASLAAAKERPIYTAVNLEKVDMGFAILGTVAAVFRTSYVANMTLVSAVDTGWWENVCNSSARTNAAAARHGTSAGAGKGKGKTSHGGGGALARGALGMANCSAWANHTFGTLHEGSFDHIILGNVKFWEPSGWSLARILGRMFGDYTSEAYATF